MKVRALVTGTHYLIDEYTQRPQVGMYGRVAEVRHREGDVFELKPYYITLTDPNSTKPLLDDKGKPKMRLLTVEEQFNIRTMEQVDDDTPESYSTAQDSINRMHDELLGGKVKKPKSRIAELHS